MLIRNVTYWSSIFITYIILLGSLSGCVVVIQVTWRFPPPVPDRTHASFTPSGNLESANVHVQCFWFVGGNQNYLEKTHIGKGKTCKLPIEFLSVGIEPITFLLYSPLFFRSLRLLLGKIVQVSKYSNYLKQLHLVKFFHCGFSGILLSKII